jgi:hypothetical protein
MHVTSMDHVEVVVRLSDKQGAGMTEPELRAATRLEPKQLLGALDDLVSAGILRFDGAARSWHYEPRSAEDRAAVESLTNLYHHRPVTLVKLIYSMPSRSIATFADAFRLREDKP